MNLNILWYVFMVIVIMAFPNIAESSAEPFPSKHRICKIKPKLPWCRG
uniref:Venom peptide n=2 Tax=Dasymutilla TaxID=50627 RepID=A0A8T9VMI0_DASSI|nr:venom peptide precursor [Dasymutilla chiron]UOY17188.1 venom peptide precursor [Dasymutilla sicheliana]UOY17189.1 venom peptide precursor [Dasymutilla sicheliana]UOY17191.1 venom peptide precursor [Dasymutilla sicheliana]